MPELPDPPAEPRRLDPVAEPDGEPAAVDVYRRLDEIDALVSSARSMPMSGACVINRGELRQLVSELRELLPVELGHARWVLERRAEIVADGDRQVEQIVAAGRQEQARLVGDSEVLAAASREAAELTAQADAEMAQMRTETDEYVERKLAALEETLHQTLAAVRHGRQTLAERTPERRPPERPARLR
jgi:hypothetical protein